MSSAWDPDEYLRFAAERRRPFDDLLSLVTPVPGSRAVDLGCGTGELTLELHRHLGAAETVGIDSSPRMLERARPQDGARFEIGQLQDWTPAAHPGGVRQRLAAMGERPSRTTGSIGRPSVRGRPVGLPGAGQLRPSFPHRGGRAGPGDRTAPIGPARHRAAAGDLCNHPPPARPDRLNVRLQVYGLTLPSTGDVVEWTRGTLLTGYKAQLDEPGYQDFEREYRRRLVAQLSHDGPYFYAFKRILAYGRRPGL